MTIKNAFIVIGEGIGLWWKDWPNQVVVCLVAILASLTIILYPAALFGIFQESLDLTHGIRTGIMGFWQGFKAFFKQNLIWGLVNTFVMAGVGFNIWFYANTKLQVALSLLVLMIMLGSFWVIWQFFTLSCFFLQEKKSLRLAWKNGLAIILGQPGYAAIIGLFSILLILISVRFYIPLFLGSMSLIAIINLMTVQKTLGLANRA